MCFPTMQGLPRGALGQVEGEPARINTSLPGQSPGLQDLPTLRAHEPEDRSRMGEALLISRSEN